MDELIDDVEDERHPGRLGELATDRPDLLQQRARLRCRHVSPPPVARRHEQLPRPMGGRRRPLREQAPRLRVEADPRGAPLLGEQVDDVGEPPRDRRDRWHLVEDEPELQVQLPISAGTQRPRIGRRFPPVLLVDEVLDALRQPLERVVRQPQQLPLHIVHASPSARSLT